MFGLGAPSAAFYPERGPSAYSPSYGSIVANGQLRSVLAWPAFASGNAVGPAFGGGPASPATVPPNASQGAPANASSRAAGNSPFNFKTSAVPLLLIMLVVSVLWLRYVHWGK